MTLNEFNKLETQCEKAEFVWGNGAFLYTRETENYSILGYVLTEFFVEIFYEPKSNEIVKIESIAKQEPPYIPLELLLMN